MLYAILKQNKIKIFLQLFMKKSKTISFASSIMRKICVFPSRSRFSVKLICCIAFGSASTFCGLLKLIENNLYYFSK